MDIHIVLNKIKKNENITNDDLLSLAISYINKNELNDYISNIKIGSRVQYDINDQTLYLSIDGCESLEFAKHEYSKKGYNQLLLFSLFHELRHAEQIKILFENPEIENPKKIKTLMYNIKYRMFGLLKNKMIIEYDANIYSLKKLTDVFNEFNMKFDDKFLSNQIKKILRAYEDNNSVIDNNINNINNEYWNEYINEINNNIKYDLSKNKRAYIYSNKSIIERKQDLYSRILRGDKLTVNEIETLNKISKNEIKTNDIFKTLNNLNEQLKLPYEKPEIEIGNIKKLFR